MNYIQYLVLGTLPVVVSPAEIKRYANVLWFVYYFYLQSASPCGRDGTLQQTNIEFQTLKAASLHPLDLLLLKSNQLTHNQLNEFGCFGLLYLLVTSHKVT
jgi:hypothetical protein